MKKGTLFSLIFVVSLALIAGGWAYHYYYIETIDKYFLVRYIPPQEERDIFGDITYSKPSFEIEQLYYYNNDEEAISGETEKYVGVYIHLLDSYDKLLELPKDSIGIIEKCRMNAINKLLEEQRTLIRTTHTRTFESEDVLDMLSKHWADKSLQEYSEKKKVDIAIYPLTKLQ